MPHGPPRGGMDETHQIAPLVAVLHRRDRTPSPEAPDLLEDGFETDAMLVNRPELDLRPGEGGGEGLGERTDLFLNSACCSGSAST
jgi:hypothetical protein